jgi:outer membrane protein OmpU
MNKLKKIGLTALAGSLVATSVFAGEVSVTGSASMEVQNVSGGTTGLADAAGKAYSMGNSINFAGSGELDNGLNVAIAFELDQGAADGDGPFDSHSMTVSSDALGSFVFSGHGGSSAAGAVDDVITGDLWDSSFGITAPSFSAGGNNIMSYSNSNVMDGVKLTASYVPDAGVANATSSTDFAVEYTGVEGLKVGYAIGEDNQTAVSATADVNTWYAEYAIGSFTVGYTASEYDSESATTTADQDYMAWEVAYTLTDDISIKYGVNEISRPDITSDVDVKVSGVTVSYTTGGMTVGGRAVSADNTKFGTGTEEDRELWELSLSFAF